MDILSVRLAALLHDCGHVCLSHIGERQLTDDPSINALRSEATKFETPKPHELLSYLIVTSRAFASFMEQLQTFYDNNQIENELRSVRIQDVADMIIGAAHYRKKYLADMINGDFDADKLDYLTRDAYFTGLRVSLDIDRLLYGMTLAVVDEQEMKQRRQKDGRCISVKPSARAAGGRPCRLIMGSSGVSALEQILFAKMQLYVTVYHHHKIRAADSMLSSYVEYMREHPEVRTAGDVFEGPVDYLERTDVEWLLQKHADDYLNKICQRLRDRELPKRVAVLSSFTTDSGIENYLALTENPDKPAILRELRGQIVEELKNKCPGLGVLVHDLVIDIPGEPSLREAMQGIVQGPNDELGVLDDYFPTDNWLVTYFSTKWRGHVFCHGDRSTRCKVAKATRSVLARHEGLAHLQLNDEAFIQAHLEPGEVDNSYQ